MRNLSLTAIAVALGMLSATSTAQDSYPEYEVNIIGACTWLHDGQQHVDRERDCRCVFNYYKDNMTKRELLLTGYLLKPAPENDQPYEALSRQQFEGIFGGHKVNTELNYNYLVNGNYASAEEVSNTAAKLEELSNQARSVCGN